MLRKTRTVVGVPEVIVALGQDHADGGAKLFEASGDAPEVALARRRQSDRSWRIAFAANP